MDLLINVGLPLSLTVFMLSLGVGPEVADFRRVVSLHFPFAIGVLSHIILLPIAAYFFVTLFALPSEIAVGFMLLSAPPGSFNRRSGPRLDPDQHSGGADQRDRQGVQPSAVLGSRCMVWPFRLSPGSAAAERTRHDHQHC
ncbi:hypothetical protein [Ruegeria lacuscaerulensis]|uniref:hypothetical protein n=1 Tax=Ruegeria lacuscaerulensis TaxID=55218 RepID=UPI00147D2D85|nr:hypothetical protein [Ruegeria lacuscaerulensis]